MDPNILDILRDSVGRKRKLKAPDDLSSKTTSDGVVAAHANSMVSDSFVIFDWEAVSFKYFKPYH